MGRVDDHRFTIDLPVANMGEIDLPACPKIFASFKVRF
jgi:hypothetical protein